MTFIARTLSKIDRIFILKALLYLEVLEQYRLSSDFIYINYCLLSNNDSCNLPFRQRVNTGHINKLFNAL